MERCMSCISKLGAPTMSRSSTETGAITPGTGQPNWILQQQLVPRQPSNCPSMSASGKAATSAGLDRMSVCSSHGSFGSSSSEYSVPRMVCQTHTSSSGQLSDLWYEPAQQTQELNAQNQRASASTALPLLSPPSNAKCKTCPPNRPPKEKSHNNGKPPMPLPMMRSLQASAIVSQPSHHKFVGPYENYDVPRPTHLHSLDKGALNAANENYDTPKKIQDSLIDGDRSGSSAKSEEAVDIYGNYDIPAIISEHPGEGIVAHHETDDWPRHGDADYNGVGCTCNKVMSWADSWISLPYCRRGNGIENTGILINKVKLSGEGRMPVVQPSGELAVYATVDMTKKSKWRQPDDLKVCECDEVNGQSSGDVRPQSQMSNYINVEPMQEPKAGESPNTAGSAPNENYMNLDFALSLENYENAKVVLQRAGFSVQHIEETLAQCVLHRNICQKCGHACKRSSTNPSPGKAQPDHVAGGDFQRSPEDYIFMEPSKSKHFPGYLPMSPAAPHTNGVSALSEDASASRFASAMPGHQQSSVNANEKSAQTPALPLRSDLKMRLLAESSASSPSPGPDVDRSKKRAEQETRIPGSAMMSSMKTTGGSPYTRKQMMDSSDRLPQDKRSFERKRSSSAESTRLPSIATIAGSEGVRNSVSGLDKESLDDELPLAAASAGAVARTQSRRASSPCLLTHKQNGLRPDLCALGIAVKPKSTGASRQSPNETETDDEISLSMNQSLTSQQSQQSVNIRRSASVPCKTQNRDSSSSNDSGVSTGSARQRTAEYSDFELPLTTATSTLRHQRKEPTSAPFTSTLHASLPRRSKSFDPLREINFQFSRCGKFAEKSTSAEAEIPICAPQANEKGKAGCASATDASSLTGRGHPYIDSRSTSSGTSDMSDYIETLSLSSHSSSDTPEGLR